MKGMEYVKGVKSELKKVKWPTRSVTFKSLVSTLVFTGILVAFFLVLDIGINYIKDLFFN